MVSLLILGWVALPLGTAVSASPPSERAVVQSANGQFMTKHYPPGAYRRGEQGRVDFRLTVEPDGSTGSCDVTRSSGFAALDQETCEFLLNYARVEPARNSDGRRVRTTHWGYIVWKLPVGTTTIASAGSQPKADRMICKRTQARDSFIKTRQCMPSSEWKRQEQVARDELDRLQGRVFCGDHGCS
jgi:TonB family protein